MSKIRAFFEKKGMDVDIIKKGFGLLLLITGIRELLYKKKSG